MSEAFMSNNKQDPSHKVAHLKLAAAGAYSKSGQFQEAEKILDLLKQEFRNKPRDPVFVQILLHLGDMEYKKKQFGAAYLYFLDAVGLSDQAAQNLPQSIIFTCLANLDVFPLETPWADRYLCQYLESTITYKMPVEQPVTQYLMRRYKLEAGLNDDTVLDMQKIAEDTLLHMAMTHLVLPNRAMELMLCEIRKELLVLAAAGDLAPTWLNLIRAYGLRAIRNEYVSHTTDSEVKLINEWLQFLDLPAQPSAEDIGRNVYDLMVLSMYMPLDRILAGKDLSQLNLQQWPLELMSHAAKTLYEPQARAQIQNYIPTITQPSDATSLKVQAQYEANPYPRWEHLSRPNKNAYFERYAYLKPCQNLDAGERLSVLVAGCGTGQHALTLSTTTTNLDITAIDLSKSSLAYAEQKRQNFAIDNVKFGQADILELDQLDLTFDIIESIGVLHHMLQPELGLQRLIKRLKPGGVLMLGLYSKSGREKFEAMRSKANRASLSRPDVLALRESILLDREEANQWADNCFDFYSYSEFRDLLFHVQETSYTIPEIDKLLTDNHLRLLGFYVMPRIEAAYRKQYPDDTYLNNLDNWQAFEANNPDTFTGMYNFHCTPL